jgi:hypothetical protein
LASYCSGLELVVMQIDDYISKEYRIERIQVNGSEEVRIRGSERPCS